MLRVEQHRPTGPCCRGAPRLLSAHLDVIPENRVTANTASGWEAWRRKTGKSCSDIDAHPNECPYYKMTIQFVPVPYQCHHWPFISCSINSYRLWWLVLIINTLSPRRRTSQNFCERFSKLVKTQVGKQPKSSNTNTMPRATFSTWVKRKKQEFEIWKAPVSNSPCFPTVDGIRPPTSHCCSRDSSSMMGCPSDHESKKSLLL